MLTMFGAAIKRHRDKGAARDLQPPCRSADIPVRRFWRLSSRPFGSSEACGNSRNTGQGCPVNPQKGMSTPHSAVATASPAADPVRPRRGGAPGTPDRAGLFQTGLSNQPHPGYGYAMSTVHEIEAAIPKLSRAEIEEIREWIDDYLEGQLELTDDVKAKLDQSRREIAAGQYTTRQPQ